jgi:hypothetical protein
MVVHSAVAAERQGRRQRFGYNNHGQSKDIFGIAAVDVECIFRDASRPRSYPGLD